MAKTNLQANYNFFMKLPAGKYQVVAGVDGNGDRKICSDGDSICAGFGGSLDHLTTVDCSSGHCTPGQILVNY